MKFEIKNLFRFPSGHNVPTTLNIYQRFWWRFVPGEIINVRWPKDIIKVGPSHRQGWVGIGEYFEYVESADPNDHYRPELERLVGRQGRHWNWGMVGNDCSENRLTIKIVRSRAKYASYFAMKWN